MKIEQFFSNKSNIKEIIRVAHHIAPELGHFEKITFSDYNVYMRIEGDITMGYESYNYKIVPDGVNSRTVERQGIATSVLKKNERRMEDHSKPWFIPCFNEIE